MENLFIQTNKNRQRLDLERIQKIQEVNKRIASTVDKPQGYQFGLIEKLAKTVAPVATTVIDPEQAEQEYMEMIDGHGIGGDEALYDFAEELLGRELYNDPYFKRRLTQYSDYILNKKSDYILNKK